MGERVAQKYLNLFVKPETSKILKSIATGF